MKDAITINVWIVRETEKALLVKNALDKECWMPRSQLKDKTAIPGKPDKFSFKVSEWVWQQKGMI